jgi:hypothetical protein
MFGLFGRKSAAPAAAKPAKVIVHKGRWSRFNSSWIFYLVALTGLYSLWNPWEISLFHAWLSIDILNQDLSSLDVRVPLLFLATLVTLVVLGMMGVGAWRELKPLGFIMLNSLIGATLWTLLALGWLDIETLTKGWFWQPIFALIMTVGFRWSVFWKSITGRVGVYEDEL